MKMCCSLNRFKGSAQNHLIPIFSGICAALGIWLGFPNDFWSFPIAVLAWPACIVLGASALEKSAGAFLFGWLASFAGIASSLYWLALPVHDVGALPWPLAGFCALLIAACLGSQGGLFAWIAFGVKSERPFIKAIVLALAWYLLEYAYAVIGGFPWLVISGALVAWPVLMQGAALCGAYLWSSLWIMCALLWALSFNGKYSIIKRLQYCLPALAVACCMYAYGFWQMERHMVNDWPDGKYSMDAVFVEGNVEQNQKWDPAFQRETLDLYFKLTREAMEAARRNGFIQPLIIWPETALPFFYEARPGLAAEVKSFVREFECPLVFGAPGLDTSRSAKEPDIYNRAFLLDPDGEISSFYDKSHLVPFGEYLPSWLDWEFLEALLQGVGIYQEGKTVAPLRFGSLALGMLICYESIFPWLADERVEAGANILVDISNDGWFGITPAPRQHLLLTSLRCIEQNRWLLRATNTGISAVIDSNGRIVRHGPQFKAGYILARAELKDVTTFYHRISRFLPYMILVIWLSCIMVLRMAGKRTGTI